MHTAASTGRNFDFPAEKMAGNSAKQPLLVNLNWASWVFYFYVVDVASN
jgi:hypothetical protein